MFCNSFSWSMTRPEDDLIVNSIKQVSDLTQSDVNKRKFLWLGGAAEPITGLASLYGVATVGEAAAQAHDDYGQQVKNILKGEFLPAFMRLPGVVQNVAASKELWVSAGVAGVGYAAYKLLYPRVALGILANIKAFNGLCSQLGVCTKSYSNIDHLRQDSGFLASQGALENVDWNTGTAIAIDNGLNNLLIQQRAAAALLKQLKSTESQQLFGAITGYGQHLNHNKMVIQSAVNAEKAQRAREQSEYMAGLRVESAQAGLTGQHIKNVQNVWKTLKDIAEFGVRHKEAIGGVIGGTYLYKKISGN
jgi:hypothetical protein